PQIHPAWNHGLGTSQRISWGDRRGARRVQARRGGHSLPGELGFQFGLLDHSANHQGMSPPPAKSLLTASSRAVRLRKSFSHLLKLRGLPSPPAKHAFVRLRSGPRHPWRPIRDRIVTIPSPPCHRWLLVSRRTNSTNQMKNKHIKWAAAGVLASVGF